MSSEHEILLLGGTGRTGTRVLEQLLMRDCRVRAVVRSVQRVPRHVERDPRLALTEADLLYMSSRDLRDLVDGCGAVISCLGHTTDLRGILGPPRDLVVRATERLYGAIVAAPSAAPVKLVLMSSVSVNQAGRRDRRRGNLERAVLWALRLLVPPAKDNQRAADFLHDAVGRDDLHAEWVVVRPDTLVEGEVSGYAVHEALVNSLFRPGKTTMANVADFMCDLVTDPEVWDAWRGRLPVIFDMPVGRA
jgi:nucleoside-diphosphate-sugar epimerase